MIVDIAMMRRRWAVLLSSVHSAVELLSVTRIRIVVITLIVFDEPLIRCGIPRISGGKPGDG